MTLIRIDGLSANVLASTLDYEVKLNRDDPLPACWHWAFLKSVVRTAELREDGHQKDVITDPRFVGWRRMWGGSRIDFHDQLRVGEEIDVCREQRDVQLKEGKAGPIAVTSVAYQWKRAGTLVISEEQDIIYRPPDAGGAGPRSESEGRARLDEMRGAVRTTCFDPVLLFRYSAATFNSHRIHYDQEYATRVEGHQGLVVHGPLLATRLAEWAEMCRGSAALSHYAFRIVRPVFANQTVELFCSAQEGTVAAMTEAGPHLLGTVRHRVVRGDL